MAGHDAGGNPLIPEEWPFYISHIEGKGRGAVAKRDIGSGEVVGVQSPVVIAPTMVEQEEKFCGRCLRRCEKGTDCQGCSVYSYCSDDCRQAHKAELHPQDICKEIKKLSENTDLTAQQKDWVVLLLQAHNLNNGGRGYNSTPGDEAFAEILTLCEDVNAIEEEVLLHMSVAVSYFLGLPLKDKFASDTANSILRKDLQNGFVLTTSSGAERGPCLAPKLTMFNHNCYPNCARIDYVDNHSTEVMGTAAQSSTMVRAIQPIPEGEELTISYTPVAYRESERREHLGETYDITCKCSRCKLEEQLEKMEEEGHDDFSDGYSDVGSDEVDPQSLYNVFVTRFVCPDPECDGTLVPIRNTVDNTRRCMAGDIPGELQNVMECNSCYTRRTEDEFERLMANNGPHEC